MASGSCGSRGRRRLGDGRDSLALVHAALVQPLVLRGRPLAGIEVVHAGLVVRGRADGERVLDGCGTASARLEGVLEWVWCSGAGACRS